MAPPEPILLVVDVQHSFLNDYTHHIPGRIRRLIEQGRFADVWFTKFINTPDSPYERFLDWDGAMEPPDPDLALELAPWAQPGRVFDKPGLTGLPASLATALKERGPETVAIVGIDTDMCVLKIAMDIFDRGIRPLVLADCCGSTAGLQAHLAGLAVLARNIGAGQLRDAGLGDGYLAAPPTPATDETAAADAAD